MSVIAIRSRPFDTGRNPAPTKVGGKRPLIWSTKMETLILSTPLIAAAGYSMIYLLGGGGLFGAIVIFFVAKMLGK
jgi:hypothetical protein